MYYEEITEIIRSKPIYDIKIIARYQREFGRRNSGEILLKTEVYMKNAQWKVRISDTTLNKKKTV